MTERRSFLAAYACIAVVFLALDAIWLTLSAERLYRPAIGHLMRESGFAWGPVLLFYPFYFVGVLVFAVEPGIAARRWARAGWRGALLGALAYATYDLTNQATLRDWPWQLSAIDIAWGTFITGVASSLACLLALRLTRR